VTAPTSDGRNFVFVTWRFRSAFGSVGARDPCCSGAVRGPEPGAGCQVGSTFLRYFWLFFALLALVFAPARANAGDDHPAAEKVALLGALAPDPAEAELWTSARAQLSDLGVEVVLRPRQPRSTAAAQAAQNFARMSGALCVIWLEAEEAAVTIFLLDRDRGRLRARRVLVSGTKAAAAEEVAVVIRSAVAALLEGVEVMMPEVALPDTPAPPAPEPQEQRTEARKVQSPVLAHDPPRLAIGYRGALYSPDAPFQSGVALGVEAKPFDLPLLLGVGYAFFPPLRARVSGVSTEIRRHPVEVIAGYELSLHTFALAGVIGLGPDWLERRTTATDPALRAEGRDRRLQWTLGLGLRGGLEVPAKIRLQAGVAAEILLNRYDHVVAGSATGDPVIRQRLARPRVDAGLSFPLK
jgi:hypothetical protein